MSKLDEYSDVLNRLVVETVACSPEEWSHGVLSIECDGIRINYKLKNESQPATASISELLRDLIDELYVRMSRNGDTWLEAYVNFDRNGDAVSFNTSFKYAQAAAPAPAAKRPWWKFGMGSA